MIALYRRDNQTPQNLRCYALYECSKTLWSIIGQVNYLPVHAGRFFLPCEAKAVYARHSRFVRQFGPFSIYKVISICNSVLLPYYELYIKKALIRQSRIHYIFTQPTHYSAPVLSFFKVMMIKS